MCAELAHQHAVDDLHKNTEHWSNQEVDHSMFPSMAFRVDLCTDTDTHIRQFPL